MEPLWRPCFTASHMEHAPPCSWAVLCSCLKANLVVPSRLAAGLDAAVHLREHHRRCASLASLPCFHACLADIAVAVSELFALNSAGATIPLAGACPCPQRLTCPALHFGLCTAGLVLEPLPVGAWAMLSVTTAVATKTLTFAQV